MFIPTLCTIARTRKQPKCPSAEEWIKKIWHIYTKEYYSVIKKNETVSLAEKWMDLQTVIQSEVRKRKESDTTQVTYHPHTEGGRGSSW